ncbi:DUF177 domain-containing protein [Sulfuricaulis sp.]|jgi:uncharacterized protein|uniref:YceD family protein n=1 Tax=Sulfuricaulis sp. TaxID=2003553 RepID=UPI00355AC29E
MSPSWKESHGHLPATIDPIQLAARGARLTGTLPLKSMPRLAQTCLDGSGDVFVDLSFERGEGEKVLLMRGTLRVSLRATCQRCLEGMDLRIEASPWLLLLRPEEGRDRLDDEADILVTDKPLSLSALVEDELLLALPMVPTHELSECPGKVYVRKEMGDGRQQTDGEKKNPFAVLDRLKKTK